MPNTPIIRVKTDSALARATELLAAHGHRREAISIVERAMRDRRNDDDVLLLVLLLMGGSKRDRRIAELLLLKLHTRSVSSSVEPKRDLGE